jgi:hypothetical protein
MKLRWCNSRVHWKGGKLFPHETHREWLRHAILILYFPPGCSGNSMDSFRTSSREHDKSHREILRPFGNLISHREVFETVRHDERNARVCVNINITGRFVFSWLAVFHAKFNSSTGAQETRRVIALIKFVIYESAEWYALIVSGTHAPTVWLKQLKCS